jgi:hypothetical protein
MKDNNIVCLQEHWLHNFEANMISTTFPTMDALVKCVDDHYPVSPMYRPRATAGVATVWPKTISSHVTPLPDGSDRLAVVRIQTNQGPLILLNTYMPSNRTQSMADYRSVLDEVREVALKYSDCLIIWAGDINASTARDCATENDKKFVQFSVETDLEVSVHTPDAPTYYHLCGSITSTIDYFIVPKDQVDIISAIILDTRNPINCSMHDAIEATLTVSLVDDGLSKRDSTLPARINWDRIDQDLYYQITDETATSLLPLLLIPNGHYNH